MAGPSSSAFAAASAIVRTVPVTTRWFGRVPLSTMQRLYEMGHQIALRREYTQEMGRGQAILHNSKTGINYAASDPRADGIAAPEPIRP